MAETGRENGDALLFITLLAMGKSVPEAAAKARIAERTAFRWAKQPGVLAQVTKLRDEMFSRAIAELASLAKAAVGTVRQLLQDESPQIRLAASRLVLGEAPRLREHAELAARIRKLENEQET